MIILGLGSNIGDRITYLRAAIDALKKIPHLSIQKLSPVYESDALLPDQAPAQWNQSYLNLALSCDTSLSPQALLHHVQRIEQTIGRGHHARWSPRVIDIDILACGDQHIVTDDLCIPHPELEHRPFALWPLCDLDPDWIHPVWEIKAKEKTKAWDLQAPLNTRQIMASIERTQLIGILNVTPDSFSDGGLFIASDAAIGQAEYLIAQGATILDIGAEATGPRATTITHDVEWLRLETVLTYLLKFHPELTVCVDTRHPETAKKALNFGVHWINDVSGFQNPAMIDAVRNSKTTLVMMHSLSVPANSAITLPETEDPVQTVLEWGKKQIHYLETKGIHRERLIFDVGIGFGKTAKQSWALIQNIAAFHALGVRLLVGHSRKSFLTTATSLPAEKRDHETARVSAFLASQHVHFLRVHAIDINAEILCDESFALINK